MRNIATSTCISLLFLLFNQNVTAQDEYNAAYKSDYSSLFNEAGVNGGIPVIIEFNIDVIPEGIASKAKVADQRQQIRSATMSILKEIDNQSPSNVKEFKTVPFLAAKLDENTLRQISQNSDVKKIHHDKLSRPTLISSSSQIGATNVWTGGYEGKGVVVAVLDTGIDNDHPFFEDRIIEEVCFSTNYADDNVNVESLCLNGEEEQFGVGTSFDPDSHGTHVAGISAGNNEEFSGVAPKVGIIAIQVFSQFDNCGGGGSCVQSYQSDQMKALEWLHEQSDNYNIAAANMSLGDDGKHTSPCDDSPLKQLIDNLRKVNIATVVSSGNEGDTNSIGAPACISSAISVGSTDVIPDTVSSFSNSNNSLDLLAPGRGIYSSIPGETYAHKSGTSMAAPHVTGAWALYREANPDATVDEILRQFIATGVPVTDTRNGIIKPRIQIDEAIFGDPPIAFISADPLTSSMNINSSSSDNLTIMNSGEGVLSWSLQVDYAEPNNAPLAGKTIHTSKNGLTAQPISDHNLLVHQPPSQFSEVVNSTDGNLLYQTHFASSEGFETGPAAGQEGWQQIGSSDTQPKISNENPSTGTQHLNLGEDTKLAAGETVGIASPLFGSFTEGVFTIEFDVRIDENDGADYSVTLLSSSSNRTAAVITFSQGGQILMQAGNVFYISAPEWTANEYKKVKLVVDTYNNTIYYYYGGEIIGTLTDTDGIAMEYISFTHNNSQNGQNGSGNFDNLVIEAEDLRSNWITASSWSGTIEPGSSDLIELNFNTRHLENKEYHAEINIHTNDPHNSKFSIPVSLIVEQEEPTSSTLGESIPSDYELSSNYPNPFNPTTKINFALPEPGNVEFKVYDILGRQVSTLAEGLMGAGYHSVHFDASNLASGMYIYQLQAGSFVQTKTMMLVK